MKRFYTFIFVCVLIQSSFAQYYDYQWKDDNPYELNYSSYFQFINDSIGWIMPTNYASAIFKTTSGGKNWFCASGLEAGFQAFQTPFVFTDKDTGYYFSYKYNSGQYFKILKTTDGGSSWAENYTFPYNSNIRNSFFLNGSKGWVLNERYNPNYTMELLMTSNGGVDWSVIYNFQDWGGNVSFITFFNEYSGLLIRSDYNISVLYKTADGGHTWSNIYSWNTPVSSSKFISQNTAYVTVNGILNKTTDGGHNWTTLLIPGGNPVSRVQVFGNSLIVATGTIGYPSWITTFNISTDDGINWNNYSVSGYDSQIYTIQILNPYRIYFTNLRYLLETKDLGQNWVKIPIGPIHNLESLIYVSGGEPFAVGWKYDSLSLKYEGTIICSPPTWRAKTTYQDQKLKCITAKNNFEIFIGGYDYSYGGNSIIYKCNNHGDSLELKYNSGGQIINSICFLDNLNGVAVGGLGMLLKTSDGGENWAQGSVMTNEDLNVITFKYQLGFIGGSGGILFRTVDGGSIWTQINLGTNKKIKSILIQNQNIVWLVGNDGLIMKSEDAGQSWITINVSEEYNFNFITLQDQLHIGIYGGKKSDNSSIIMESHNGGLSFGFEATSLQLESINCVHKDINGSKAWAIGDHGTIYYTADWFVPVELTSFTASLNQSKVNLYWQTATELNNNGFEIQRKLENSDWITIGFKKGKGTTSEQTDYSYIDDISGVSAKKLMYRLKQIDYNGSFKYSDEIEVVTLPLQYNLFQNYPNPFNPNTVIKYEIPQNSFIKLEVFDLLGRQIKTLVNEMKPAGRYEIEFDASSLSSGIYIYKISGNNFNQSKKMILLK
jgi:photosystem II stability/assembly factor-like uncharacterized protein